MSCFAIVILTVIGVLFQTNHHSMMGSIDDPENGPAVAVTVFSAVAVYAVSFLGSLSAMYLLFGEGGIGLKWDGKDRGTEVAAVVANWV